MQIFEHQNYREYLKALLQQRTKKNTAYSLRAFAQNLGVQNSQLSEVMNGKANFSLASAIKVTQKLALTDDETEYFCLLVQASAEHDPRTREIFAKKIQSIRSSRSLRKITQIDSDRFAHISDWYHSAILELASLDHFILTAKSAADAIKITEKEAKTAIGRLEKLGLIRQNGTGDWERLPEDVQVSSAEQNLALRSFYRQMMSKASEALETQTPGERLSGYETISLSKESLQEARKAYETFLDEMAKISRRTRARTDVYHVFVHCFNLTQNLNRTAS